MDVSESVALGCNGQAIARSRCHLSVLSMFSGRVTPLSCQSGSYPDSCSCISASFGDLMLALQYHELR